MLRACNCALSDLCRGQNPTQKLSFIIWSVFSRPSISKILISRRENFFYVRQGDMVNDKSPATGSHFCNGGDNNVQNQGPRGGDNGRRLVGIAIVRSVQGPADHRPDAAAPAAF